MEKKEKSKIIRSILYPCLFVGLLWGVKLIEIIFHLSFIRFGIYPREYRGLLGIITSPLIHGSFDHLFSNTVPLLVLGMMLFYFYRPIAFSVFFWVYLMTGIWVWAAGRDAYHIGASGLVYGFASFLFFSGVIRREKSTMVLSLLVVFLYGSMVWGILPVQPHVSWESHLLGGLAGLIIAFYFRHEGPQKKEIIWNEEEEDHGEWRITDQNSSS